MRFATLFPSAVKYILIACMGLIGFACSEPVDPLPMENPALDALFIKGADQWAVTWVINRQPVYSGSGEQVQEITFLAKPGDNTVVVKARAQGLAPPLPPCQTQLVALDKRRMQETVLGGLDISAPVQTVLRKEFGFNYRGKAKRTWEQADDIAPLAAQDKDHISAIVAALQKAFRERDIAAVRDMAYAPWLVVDHGFAAGRREEQLQQLANIFKNSDYSIVVSPATELAAAIGTKLVMVYTPDASIISAVPDLADPNYADQWLQIVDIRRLYFVKLDGRWFVLDYI
jgi:hypothetical protein